MNILTMTTPDMENGNGCRVTLWFAGCGHHCEGCQNQHTWNYEQGVLLSNDDVKMKIFTEVDHDYIQGVTLSGGDPLMQTDDSLEELKKFIIEFKGLYPSKDIWIYSGYTFEEICASPKKKEILELCDVLVDGPYICSLNNDDLPFRGSENQRIIYLKDALENAHLG